MPVPRTSISIRGRCCYSSALPSPSRWVFRRFLYHLHVALFYSRRGVSCTCSRSLRLASSLSLSHPPHPVPPIRPGTAQHVRPRGEALPRTAPVRRSRTRRAMVPRCRHGPAHAEGERRGAGGPRGCEPRRDRPLRLAGHDRPAHIVQGPRVDEVALRRGERLLITRECANSLG